MTLAITGANIVGSKSGISVQGGQAHFYGKHSLEGLTFDGTEITIAPGSQVEIPQGTLSKVDLIFPEPVVLLAMGSRFTNFSDFVAKLVDPELAPLGGKLAEPFKSRFEQLMLHIREAATDFDGALNTLNLPSATAAERKSAIEKLGSWSGALYEGTTEGSRITKTQAQHFEGTPELDRMRIRIDGAMEALRSQALIVANYYTAALQRTTTQSEA